MDQVERFWAQVVKTDDHWLFTGAISGNGYGTLFFGGKQESAHRVAWFIATGIWPVKCVLHKCDTRPCVRFDHLFEGTKGQNNRDRAAKGRSDAGEDRYSSKLTKDEVLQIRLRALNSKETHKALAEEFGVSRPCISAIVSHKRWK